MKTFSIVLISNSLQYFIYIYISMYNWIFKFLIFFHDKKKCLFDINLISRIKTMRSTHITMTRKKEVTWLRKGKIFKRKGMGSDIEAILMEVF